MTNSSPASIARLQELLDESARNAGDHVRATFGIPDQTLSAAQLVRYLTEPVTVALATATAQGEPRVAPVHAVFYEASFCVPTVSGSLKAKHTARHPAVSLTHWTVDDVAIIVHGDAEVVKTDHPDFAKIDKLYDFPWWKDVREQGNGVYLKITGKRMYAWAERPENYPS